MAPSEVAARNPIGRPPKYKEEYAEQAYKLCLLGMTNEEMASFFEVNITTFKRWLAGVDDFRAAVLRGREPADAEISVSLYKRAKGYSHPDVHISTYQGEVIETPIVKHYPPDTGAITLWLTNRQRGKWQSVQRVEQTGPDGVPLAAPVFNVSFDAAATPKDDEPEQK